MWEYTVNGELILLFFHVIVCQRKSVEFLCVVFFSLINKHSKIVSSPIKLHNQKIPTLVSSQKKNFCRKNFDDFAALKLDDMISSFNFDVKTKR